jgi:hypothetical protein
MANGSGVSRGDRNRNARLTRLRALVPVDNAVVGIDLADAKQMVVVTDRDSKGWRARLSGARHQPSHPVDSRQERHQPRCPLGPFRQRARQFR